jgi:hypothetical protein
MITFILSRALVKERLKYHMSLVCPVQMKKNFVNRTLSMSPKSNYIFHEESVNEITELDDLDKTINDYITLISNHKYKCPLSFWKSNEIAFPLLAPLAKKFLGVPASSASVERMFNISGHIFSNKRRRTGVKLFESLVFCKLNEIYL